MRNWSLREYFSWCKQGLFRIFNPTCTQNSLKNETKAAVAAFFVGQFWIFQRLLYETSFIYCKNFYWNFSKIYAVFPQKSAEKGPLVEPVLISPFSIKKIERFFFCFEADKIIVPRSIKLFIYENRLLLFPLKKCKPKSEILSQKSFFK